MRAISIIFNTTYYTFSYIRAQRLGKVYQYICIAFFGTEGDASVANSLLMYRVRHEEGLIIHAHEEKKLEKRFTFILFMKSIKR